MLDHGASSDFISRQYWHSLLNGATCDAELINRVGNESLLVARCCSHALLLLSDCTLSG